MPTTAGFRPVYAALLISSCISALDGTVVAVALNTISANIGGAEWALILMHTFYIANPSSDHKESHPGSALPTYSPQRVRALKKYIHPTVSDCSSLSHSGLSPCKPSLRIGDTVSKGDLCSMGQSGRCLWKKSRSIGCVGWLPAQVRELRGLISGSS